MSRKTFVVTFAVAALTAASAFADVPDGRGGRTAPWKLNRPDAVVALAHACCGPVAAPVERIASNPAELKALGHTAWVSRSDVPAGVSACYKRFARRAPAYTSPAELKAFGHVAARNAAPAPSATRTCCDTGRCPMRSKATASR